MFGRFGPMGNEFSCAKKGRIQLRGKGVLQARQGWASNAARNNSGGLLPQPRIIISG
ncbi:hypothetical protein PLUA15_220069 [Pseudomonas lundensis]|uniref:Uncharacterized protein n=1 Tax=Pseudomonas lundensis TaxID=86185 RepID=A0AAX2H6Q7_9PSED|nr:hypothetical protein PLUA15_220069 [Pseudomonas lundensis]